MGRLKTLGFFAVLGFTAGVVAYFAYNEFFSTLLQMVPDILHVEWVLSGIAGSMFTILTIILWAYLSPPAARSTG